MRFAIVVVAVALVTRLAIVLWLADSVPHSDFALYHAAGIEIAQNPRFLFDPAAAARFPHINLWPPLYPIFLALVYTLFGPDHRHAVFVQVFLGALVCWLVIRCASRALGERAGLVAGLIAALHPHLVFLTNQLASENLYVVWLALGLWRAQQVNVAHRRLHPILTGIVLGLGALTRAIGLVVPLVLVVWLRRGASDRRDWIRTSAWLLLGVGIVLAPWTVRNVAVAGRPALVCFGGGLNFYFGHNPGPLGYRDLAATPLAGLHDPAAIDAAGTREGLRWIVRHPLTFVRNSVEKMIALYAFPDYALHANSGILVPDTRAHPELEAVARAKLARQRGRDRWLHGPCMHFTRGFHLSLLAFAALGLWWSFRPVDRLLRHPALSFWSWVVLGWTAAHVIFWAQPRFRHPLEIPLTFLAAFALTRFKAWRPRLHRTPGLAAPRSSR